MIKYSSIEGYKNLGEIELFSHLYQFMENNKETPITILIHAYEGETKFFKGYVFNNTKTYKSIPLTESEIEEIEKYTGAGQQVDFLKFIVGTIAEDYYKDFICA